MNVRSIGKTGNSLTSGAFAVNPARTLFPGIIRGLRERGHLANEPWIKSVTDGGGMYNIHGFWRNTLRHKKLDLLVWQGCLEQEFAPNEAATLSTAIAPTSTVLSFLRSGGGSATINSGLYRLYDANNEEWVLAESNGGSPSTSYKRGLFGTVARYWPAGTTVEINAATGYSQTSTSGFAATLARYGKCLAEAVACKPGIILVGDCWFTASSVVTNAIAALVAELQADYPLIEFVRYEKADGTRIYADEDCIGPTAVTTSITYSGAYSPQDLTVVCENTRGVRRLAPGRFVGIWKSSTGSFAQERVEIVKIATVDYAAKTFTVAGDTGGGRAQWGSSAIADFTNTETVAAVSSAYVDPRYGVDNLGAASEPGNAWDGCGYFSNGAFQYDTHPTDQGYDELALAYLRAFDRVAERC